MSCCSLWTREYRNRIVFIFVHHKFTIWNLGTFVGSEKCQTVPNMCDQHRDPYEQSSYLFPKTSALTIHCSACLDARPSMSNLSILLNPDDGYVAQRSIVASLPLSLLLTLRVLRTGPFLNRTESEMLSPASAMVSPSSMVDENSDPPKQPKTAQYASPVDHAHEWHSNCPDSFSCLPDTDSKPQHTLPILVRCAILGSPRRKLTIREIYAAMEDKYPYYKNAGVTWKVCWFVRSEKAI